MKFLFFILISFACTYATPISAKSHKNTEQVQMMDDFNSEFSSTDKNNKNEIDPLSGYNRVMTNVNDYFYLNILDPVARGYKVILPKPIRKGVNNILDNLAYPLRLLNNLLQFKFKNAYTETQRFILNSTIGLAGFMDVANDKFHIKQKQEDFGQTLGFYGVGGGFYIVLPLIGPSNLRDTAGLITDGLLNPMTYTKSRGYNLLSSDFESIAVKSANIINYSSLHVGEYEKLKKDAIDLYPFLKNIYKQRRKKQISE